MAQTRRITHNATAPTTEYGLGADIIAQSASGNYSVVRTSATCINRGGTTSFSNYAGYHTCSIDAIGSAPGYSGVLPSGVAANAVRWDNYSDLSVAHAADGNRGNVTLRQVVHGWHGSTGYDNTQTTPFGGFPRIPKPASAPGTPVVSELLPTSMRLTWTASTDNGGSAIDGYLLRYWPNAEGTGPYTDVSLENNLTRVVTGLTPGLEYRFVVYAHNGSYGAYSVASGAVVQRTISGMWAKYLGEWKRAVPFVKVAGIWRAVSVFIKDTTWKRGG
jgi:hypothetical protein